MLEKKGEGNQGNGTGVCESKNRRQNCDSQSQREMHGRNHSRRDSSWEPWDRFPGTSINFLRNKFPNPKPITSVLNYFTWDTVFRGIAHYLRKVRIVFFFL